MVLVAALGLIGVAGFLVPPEKERRFAYFCIAGLIGSIFVSALGGVAIVRFAFALWAMIVLISVFLAIYFVPTIIAKKRRHRNFMAIAVVNLLLGWSFIFWVVALVWSLRVERKPSAG